MISTMARNYARIPDISDISQMTTKQLRESYTQMRDIFQKRVKRMSVSEAGAKSAKAYMKGDTGYIPTLKERTMRPTYSSLSEAEKRRALEHEVKILADKVRASGQLVKGQVSLRAINARNAKISGTLKAHGFDISKSDVPKFGDFMDILRDLYGKKLPESVEAAEFFSHLKYDTRQNTLSSIVQMWKEYVANGYSLPETIIDLFLPGL